MVQCLLLCSTMDYNKAEVGIYKRKQESKKTRKQELDQENKNSAKKAT